MSRSEIPKRTADIVALPQPADPLSALYLRYRRDITEFVRRKFGPGPPEPEDVAQAVFLQIAAQGHPELIENPRSFLLKTAQNVVLDHYRRVRRQSDPSGEAKRHVAENLSDFDPERVVTGEERLRILVSLLAALPPAKRQLVLLSRVHGWSCEAIGQHLGLSAEAVQKQIERVLKECMRALDRRDRIVPEHKGKPHGAE